MWWHKIKKSPCFHIRKSSLARERYFIASKNTLDFSKIEHKSTNSLKNKFYKYKTRRKRFQEMQSFHNCHSRVKKVWNDSKMMRKMRFNKSRKPYTLETSRKWYMSLRWISKKSKRKITKLWKICIIVFSKNTRMLWIFHRTLQGSKIRPYTSQRMLASTAKTSWATSIQNSYKTCWTTNLGTKKTWTASLWI